jgi:hypothetical protein
MWQKAGRSVLGRLVFTGADFHASLNSPAFSIEQKYIVEPDSSRLSLHAVARAV